MIPTGSIEIREYRAESDKAFIYSTWLRNYKYSSYFAKRIRPSVFFSGQHKLIEHLLNKPDIRVLIAYPKDDDDTILGYLACEIKDKPVVHFTFVKEAFRKMGVAATLFKHVDIEPSKMHFTHWTIPVDEFIRKWPDMIYDPYGL